MWWGAGGPKLQQPARCRGLRSRRRQTGAAGAVWSLKRNWLAAAAQPGNPLLSCTSHGIFLFPQPKPASPQGCCGSGCRGLPRTHPGPRLLCGEGSRQAAKPPGAGMPSPDEPLTGDHPTESFITSEQEEKALPPALPQRNRPELRARLPIAGPLPQKPALGFPPALGRAPWVPAAGTPRPRSVPPSAPRAQGERCPRCSQPLITRSGHSLPKHIRTYNWLTLLSLLWQRIYDN